METTQNQILSVSDKLWLQFNDLIAWLPMLGIALVVLVLFILLARQIRQWQGLFKRLSSNAFMQNIYAQLTQTVIIILGVLLALEILDATALVGAVLGTAGVVGLALGFAFRDIVENYLAGILLSLRQPFAPNDAISVAGETGKVIKLTSRATILLTYDGNHVRLPNATVFKENLTNYTRNPKRRFDFTVGVGSDEDLSAAQRIGTDVLANMNATLIDPAPSSILEPPGDSSIGVHFFAWVDQSITDFGKAKSEAIRLVTKALADAEIDMPEPIHRVRVDRLQQGGLALTVTKSETEESSEKTSNPTNETESAKVAKREESVEMEQDTSVDTSLEAQVNEERAKADSDLLDASAKQE